MRHQAVACLVGAALLGLSGCSQETGAVSGQQERIIRGADPDAVLTQAAIILQREFGRVKVDPVSRRIDTTPAEFTTASDSGTVRDMYRGSTTMRRIAALSVSQRGGTTVARLRVDVERRDTDRQTIMQPQGHRLGDTPGAETPIDRDAATTHQQNTVWTRVRRDHRLETALLEELRDHFERLAAEPEEPAEPEPVAPAPDPAPPSEPSGE